MTTPTALTMLVIVALVGYGAYPFVAPWWNTARPTRCPACNCWKPIADMIFVLHNSGMHIRVCENCYRHLYTPSKRSTFTQDQKHDPEATA
jgi:hypothetical protein